jgi:hypothetical protein
MTVYNGAWEYGGGNGMQVVMDVTWSAVSEGSSTTVATVKFYTDNQYTYSDAQVLDVSANLGSNYSYTNSSGSSQVLRLTRTYTHTYTAGSYNSSPGNITFSATVSGTYNGISPSVSATVAIPARPSHAPTAPTSVSATPGNGSISVSFAAPSDTGTGGVSYYQSSDNNSTWTGSAASPISNPFTISGTNGTSATGYVRAVSNYGGTGPSASASATPRTTPSAPTSFASSAGTFGTVALSWVAPSDGGNAISSYTLTRTNGATTVTLTAPATNVTTYNDTTVDPAVSYTYTLLASNAAGAGASTTTTITSLGGISRIWNGTVYVATLPKVWNGTTWTDAQARMWNGTEWKHGI